VDTPPDSPPDPPMDPPTVRTRLRRDLARALILVEDHDLNYELRNALVLHAVATAAFLGYPSGFRIDPAEPEWPVAFIELPLPAGAPGQVSWHLPRHPKSWDLHTTSEKYARVHAFADATASGPPESPGVSRLLALADLAEALAREAACAS
jgi:hypothetical protein